MRKLIISIAVLCCSSLVSFAQSTGVSKDGELQKYRRSSLCSFLISHSGYPYAEEIDSAFMAMPMPDKFNEHNVYPRSFESSMVKMKQKGDKKTKTNLADANLFFEAYVVPKRIVGRWFNRADSTGCFDMSLIQERGYYDASQLDIAMAKRTERKLSALGDAGEELIGKTFVIVNDITFVDKGVASAQAAAGIQIAGAIAGQLFGSAFNDLGKMAAAATNEIDGFKVNVTSYLYRLVWDDEVSATFYQDYWVDSNYYDPDRVMSWYDCNMFSLSYVGETSASAENLSSKSYSTKTKSQQMLKVCARAVDKSIVQLQREYEEFKVNVPVFSIAPNGKTAEVQIGLKEGVDEKSLFEVLLPEEDAEGKITYKQIGKLKPVKGKIWDNRFGALEEALDAQKGGGNKSKEEKAATIEAVSLNATTFKLAGGKVLPGCLVRELK